MLDNFEKMLSESNQVKCLFTIIFLPTVKAVK